VGMIQRRGSWREWTCIPGGIGVGRSWKGSSCWNCLMYCREESQSQPASHWWGCCNPQRCWPSFWVGPSPGLTASLWGSWRRDPSWSCCYSACCSWSQSMSMDSEFQQALQLMIL
jgi:hypothetical protein